MAFDVRREPGSFFETSSLFNSGEGEILQNRNDLHPSYGRDSERNEPTTVSVTEDELFC